MLNLIVIEGILTSLGGSKPQPHGSFPANAAGQRPDQKNSFPKPQYSSIPKQYSKPLEAKMAEMSMNEIAGQFRAQRARTLEDLNKPLMDRALNAMIGALNDTGGDAQPA